MSEQSVPGILTNASAEERSRMLTDLLRQWLVDFLEMDHIDEITPNQNFAELGTTSMQAVDFKLLLESKLNCSLRTTLLFDYPSLDLLVNYLLKDVLKMNFIHENIQSTATENTVNDNPPPVITSNYSDKDIAIVAIEGMFPGAENGTTLWKKIESGERAVFSTPGESSAYRYGKLAETFDAKHLEVINISPAEYFTMSRQQQLMYKLIADALFGSSIAISEISTTKTGVFIAAQQVFNSESENNKSNKTAYHIPLANEISFRLNLQGPSELINTFCTSVYVALHRAVQSIQLGECNLGIVGGINLISAAQFISDSNGGLYDELLSNNNSTHSFCESANGFVRSEGAGVLILKSLAQAEKDCNKIIAVVKSTAVHHGGRGFSPEAPNVKGIKETIRICLQKGKIQADTIDYIEAHGIGNHLADAMELNATNDAYIEHRVDTTKKWVISSVKPTVGHPELAAGMASLIKSIKALEHKTIPGIAGLDHINKEIGYNHSLILQAGRQPWQQHNEQPRRVALNSFAIGGVNAHVVLEEYLPITQSITNFIFPKAEEYTTHKPTKALLSKETEMVLDTLFQQVFNIPLTEIDRSLSAVHYGFDSIKLIQLVRRLNQQLGLDIKLGQILSIDNFEDFFLLVEKEKLRILTAITGSENQVEKEDETLLTTYPISEVQKGLWYINETMPLSSSFNVPIAFKVKQALNIACLREALKLMLYEYPVLRSNIIQNIHSEDVVHKINAVSDELTNVNSIELTSAEGLNDLLFKLLREPFNLKTDSLLRLYVIESPAMNEHIVYFVIHHIVIDGVSGVLFMHSFWNKYHQLMSGKKVQTPLPDTAFFDFISWEQNYLKSTKANDDLNWWKTQLFEISPAIHLPYDSSPSTETAHTGVACEKLRLNATEFSALKMTAKKLNVNVSVLLLAAFNVLIHKISQDEDILVTTPVEGRPKQIHEKSIGCYINLIITRSKLLPDKTFAELVQETKQRFVEGMDHSFYPFSKLTSELGLVLSNPNESPLPVSYTYQNIFDGLLENKQLLNGVEPFYSVYQETDDHYTLEVYDWRDSLEINLKYKRHLFDSSTIQRHVGYFKKITDEIIESPYKQIKHIDVLSEEEKKLLLQTFNNTHAAFNQEVLITELFEDQAILNPEHIALIYRTEKISYRQLDEKTNTLACYLQQNGIKQDDIVGIYMTRSGDMIVAALAILKAGAAYLHLEPTYAADRIAFTIKDAKPRSVITQSHLQTQLNELLQEDDCKSIVIDNYRQTVFSTTSKPAKKHTPDSLAYIIYTSGSTGKPKGVMITHGALLNLSKSMVLEYNIGKNDSILQFASLSFDMSVEEIFPYLIAGASIVIRDEDDIEPEKFYRLVTDNNVNILNIPPLYYHVIDELEDNKKNTLFSQLRMIAFGGEALPEPMLKSARQQHIQLFNAYGPTEYTVNTTIANVSNSSVVTIGKPVFNTRLYVLSNDLTLLPIGVAGELHISGAGLAKGYLNEPELTKQKFIQNPYGQDKLYKTGDLVRWLADGNIQYLGRIDNQVKIRGYRVEPGEIEAVLLKIAGIKNAVVVAQESKQGKKLVAFYVADELMDADTIRKHLLKNLPEYMVPAAFVKTEKLPLTANGKINRKQLESLKVDTYTGAEYTPPETDLERSLVAIWQEVLGLTKIGVHDNFFDLGGHSLLAIQIVLRINKELGLNSSLNTFFKSKDIRSLAAYLLANEQSSAKMEDTLANFEEGKEEFTI